MKIDLEIVMDEIEKLRNERDRLWKLLDTYGIEDKEYWNTEDLIDDLNDKISEQVALIGSSDVIKMLEKLTDEGVNPTPALGYWLSSWC